MKSGVYKHFKGGDYYQLLFVARFMGPAIAEQNSDIFVFVENRGGEIIAATDSGIAVGRGNPTTPLFVARSHAKLMWLPGMSYQLVAVYVPLYTNKSGRRISVRPSHEFNEIVQELDAHGMIVAPGETPVHRVERFTYVGQEIPQ